MFVIIVRRDSDRHIVEVLECERYNDACDLAARLTDVSHTATIYQPA